MKGNMEVDDEHDHIISVIKTGAESACTCKQNCHVKTFGIIKTNHI